ncbi:carbohydrate binding family 9 domain-containing protein [Ferruginibacter lapsinanis]|uniref:DUF5916 domain-containing protein n=1 Tax=Ferruginibacter lapsinanis TaxID=563172 RepID=UPI001E573B33|nr:DUF5916 domain-containing protein [Ferruginibacter lapsinanis]UEG50937.1 carbohydrate binding family 9 domain-containing protein [Ferruginibacter lapsinanis]
MLTKIYTLLFCAILTAGVYGQTVKRELKITRIVNSIKIDAELDETDWSNAQIATHFIELRPTPFRQEDSANATKIYLLYKNDGIYIGGYCHERNKDSIAAELSGRDGFGNNDFVGVIFDTYYDRLNGFEYFITPLGEQWDAKMSSGGNEDFSWNAVWKSAAKLQKDGWSFEMFLPYSAIRFGKKQQQDWGFNVVRRRQKSGQQLFWQPIDPTVNGFLSQEGLLKNLENIKPPVRLQFSPYFSAYVNRDGLTKNNTTQLNGGMDVKYGINQAFTLDMTLIPDFGQVVTDNRILNLSPFEQKFSENRSFFTEGTELFNKGNLFYSRRIGNSFPIHYGDAYTSLGANENVVKNPGQSKLLNATKLSGRTQRGLGIGVLNALTNTQFATIADTVTQNRRKFETDPLTNYNVFVLDQTLKHNSSISFVNTNTWRSGPDYDANVSSALFNFNDKTNTWNVGGNISISNLFGKEGKDITGYAHGLYFGKTSGKFNFNVWQELSNDKYDKSDLGYFTNNNTMDQGIWMAYNWNKPKGWYNYFKLNWEVWYGRLVSPIDLLRRREMMYQNAGGNINFNAQIKNLWTFGATLDFGLPYNDFYEARSHGRVFQNKGRVGLSGWWSSNAAKKLSWGGNFFTGTGSVFQRTSINGGLYGKIRFNSKFSVDYTVNIENYNNQPGWAYTGYTNNSALLDTVIFSRRKLNIVENIFNVKYSFNNRMWLTLRARHYWSKVDPLQFYELDKYGILQTPSTPFTKNVNQNYNFLSIDMVYNWQFAPGSFFSIVWKDVSENFYNTFEKNYFHNLGRTIGRPGYNNNNELNSLSLKVIYFLDYLSLQKNKKG